MIFEIQANNSILISNQDSKHGLHQVVSSAVPTVCSKPAAAALLPELLAISPKLKGGNHFYYKQTVVGALSKTTL